MPGSSDRVWDDALRMGVRNREIIELARRHCLNMEFVPSGGRGMAEASSGLPVDMRQVRCPVALGSMSSNLPWIATDFFREHCVGCDQRRPTGEVPNLATLVDDQDAAAEESRAAEQTRLEHAAADWQRRVDARRALGASSGEAMDGVLRDIDMLDCDPRIPTAKAEREAAHARLAALADRAPGLLTPGVVAAIVELVATVGAAFELLDVLRRLARHRPEFASNAVGCAISALRTGHATWAGPCIAELIAQVDATTIDEGICRPLVLLAGAPALDHFGRSQLDRTNDPTGLQAVATVAPHVVTRVLSSMLPPPAATEGLVLPEGASVPHVTRVSSYERAAAAGAVRALAETAPELASELVDTLVLDLAVPPADSYADTPDDLDRFVPNPAKASALSRVADARGDVTDAHAGVSAAIDHAATRARRPGSGGSATVDPAAGRHLTVVEANLAAAQEGSRDTPSHLPLRLVRPGSRLLETGASSSPTPSG